jgi:predicted RNase H-like HicB family nuclease
MLTNYTLTIVKSDGWYAGFVKELPGAHSQGKTIEEVKENIKESIKMVVESNYRHLLEGYEKVIEEKIFVKI